MLVTVRLRSLAWFAVGVVTGLATVAVMTAPWSVEATPGRSDTTTVPITACRLVDTRPDSRVGPRDKPLRAEETYVIDALHPTTGCSGKIPASADGLVLNVTAARMTAPTFISIWDTGPFPGTSSLNPVPGAAVPNAVTTKLEQSQHFRVYNLAGTSHIVIDVVGYLTSSSLEELHDRLRTVETGGANASVLNQIASLRVDVEALETSTATQHSQIADLGDTADAQQAQIERIEVARPTVWSDREDFGEVDDDARIVAAVDIVAPADGVLTVLSSVQVEEEKAGDGVQCSITERDRLDPDRLQHWESSGISAGSFGQLSGIDTISVTNGERLEINLVCRHLGFSDDADIRNSVLTAMFMAAG